jgi:hypothetical protein
MMTEAEATEVVDGLGLSEDEYGLNGIIEDLMDGWDLDQSRDEILGRNTYLD